MWSHCGDNNAIVDENVVGCGMAHGGYGSGKRNVEGEMMLECAEVMELAVLNLWF